MPEPLKVSEVNSKTDPSTAKQYDNESSAETKFADFYAIADKQKIGLLGTYRKDVGPVHRAMAVSKRTGPDFLFLANAHSKKFEDLKTSKQATITFQDSSTQDWVSITGVATTADNKDPRIKEIFSKPVAAWFGDLKDGVHDGGPDDPRMSLIEIQAKYITYWKKEVGTLGFIKEVAGATLTGGVANTGVIREMGEAEIAEARSKDSSLSS